MSINVPALHGSGGAGAILTIGSNGQLTLNTNNMQPFNASVQGLTESIQFTGSETGVISVSGNRFTGRYQAGNLAAVAKVNGVRIKLPLSKFSHASNLSWQSFSCTISTLRLIAPSHVSIWTFSRA